MAKELVKLELDEISLVDHPANKSATVAVFKSGNKSEEGEMADVEKEMDGRMKDRMKMYMDKGMSEKDAKAKAEMDMKKSAEDLLKSNDELSAKVDELTAEVEKMKDAEVTKSEETVEVEGKVVKKSDVPEAVFEIMKSQAADIAKMKEEREFEALTKRAEATFANLSGSASAKAKLLKAAEGDKEVMELLKAADGAAKEIFVEKGDEVVDDGSDPMTQIDKMAADYASEHGVAKETAFAEVTKSGEGRKLLIEARSK